MTRRFETSGSEMTRRFVEMTRRFDTVHNQITQRLDSQSRWMTTSLIVLFHAMLGNILKDFLR
jgi:hypothetical protein